MLKPLALLICSPFLRLRTSLSTFHHTILHFSFYIFIITRKAVTVTLTEREIFILSFSLYYIITRVAPHCVNTLRILHAAYDATKGTCPLINTLVILSLQTALVSLVNTSLDLDVYKAKININEKRF